MCLCILSSHALQSFVKMAQRSITHSCQTSIVIVILKMTLYGLPVLIITYKKRGKGEFTMGIMKY